MNFKYRPLPPIQTQIQEKSKSNPQSTRESVDSSSTLGDDLDHLDFECTNLNGVDASESIISRSLLRVRTSSCAWLWLMHAALFAVSLTLFILAVMVRSSTLKHVRDFSAWSPAATAIQYQSVKYNISTKGNRFVGAGPKVDQAWREISYDMGDQWISKADIRKLGMPETSLKVHHPQTGEDGYRVGMEAFHQLHCINLLRRVTYKEYYEPLGGEFGKGPEELQKHTDHCIEVLRLNTQCNADIGLFTFYMIDGDPLAWPELNSNHVCRNFDRVRQWATEHSVGNMEILSS